MRLGRVLRALTLLAAALFVFLTVAGVAMFRRDLPAGELASTYGNRQAILDRLNGPADPHLDTRIAELGMPVLVLWGEADRWVPLGHARRFEREIASAELKIYPGVGHVPMEELPDETARDADAFLGRD